jgi:hypothetical protein
MQPRSFTHRVAQVLYDEARKATAAVGLTCRIGDQSMAGKVDALMGEFSFRMDEAVDGHATGTLQFILRAREARDQQRAIVVANRLKELMERRTWSVVGGEMIETCEMRVQVLKGFKVGRGVTLAVCDLNLIKPSADYSRTK